MQTERNRQEIGQGNFQEPEAEEIDNGRSDGIARAVEGLEHDHAVGIADVAVTENAEAGGGQRNDGGVVGEQAHRGLGEKDEENADGAEKSHVPKAGAPDGSFGAFGLLGAEVLADERGGGVAEPPARQDDENEYANGDGIAGEGCGAEDADNADETNQTGVPDEELQEASERATPAPKQTAHCAPNFPATAPHAL